MALNHAGQWDLKGWYCPPLRIKMWQLKNVKMQKNVYASILGHLDMSYMQHILNIPYWFASNI